MTSTCSFPFFILRSCGGARGGKVSAEAPITKQTLHWDIPDRKARNQERNERILVGENVVPPSVSLVKTLALPSWCQTDYGSIDLADHRLRLWRQKNVNRK